RLAETRLVVFAEDEVRRIDRDGRSFVNVNERADYASARALVENSSAVPGSGEAALTAPGSGEGAPTAPGSRPARSPRGSSACVWSCDTRDSVMPSLAPTSFMVSSLWY